MWISFNQLPLKDDCFVLVRYKNDRFAVVAINGVASPLTGNPTSGSERRSISEAPFLLPLPGRPNVHLVTCLDLLQCGLIESAITMTATSP